VNPGTIILVLTLATGQGVPDITHKVKQPSVEACLKEAREFLDAGVPKIDGVLGIQASCLLIPVEEEHP
jgi:hypothetical protein